MHKVVALVILTGGVAHADTKTKANVTLDGATVTGALDDKAVDKIVMRAKSKVLACYKKQVAKNALLAGSTKVTFTVAADGKVSNATMQSLGRTGDIALGACVAGVFAKLKMPKPTDGATADVSYSLTFDATVEQGGAFASLTGTGDISSGFDDTNIYGGLLGSSAGAGGGGTGVGSLGVGTIGSKTPGAGTGAGYGVGGGLGGMRGRRVPTVGVGQAGTTGDLDKGIIRRYVKRNIQKIQYCYEKELLAKPQLRGTVTIDFTIDVDGRVTSSKAASGIDKDVDACVASVIKGIEFPKPKSGVVTVKYPFTFMPADTSTPPAPKKTAPPPTNGLAN